MNIVTIHPAPKKPLTFADIKPGAFVWAGQPCTKLRYELHSTVADSINATRSDGEVLCMSPSTIVTLPDAPPPQDDTVEYGDLADGEMFAWDGEVWQLSDGFVRDTGYRRMQRLRDGETMSLMPSTRVRRVDSVTITRDQGSETK